MYRAFPRLSPALLLLAAAVRAQEPDLTVTIRALEAQMKYDLPVIEAKPGARIRIEFQNHDGMPHNLVVCKAGEDKGMEVAQAAWALGDQGIAKSWIPTHARVIAHTKMVQPKEKDQITFTLPNEPGTYPYVCTFPGHAQLMNGMIQAKAPGGLLKNLKYDHFVGNWDRLPDFKKLTPSHSGDAEGGKIDIARDCKVDQKQHFGLVYRGELDIPKDGDYQFFVASDDGARVVIDEKTVVTNDGIHPATDVKTGKTRLTAGTHAIRVEYFEAAGEEALYVGWKGPGFSETALTNWIPPARTPGSPEHNKPGDITLAPVNGEAVMHRNFIEGASPRAIGVGYPGGINAVWDANTANLALLWRGAFVDVRRHWTDRGGGNIAPLGYDLVKPAPASPALARLETPEATWPGMEGKRIKAVEYRGHQLDAKRFPTYRWETTDLGLAVSETHTPSGDFAPGGNARLTRTLAVTAKGTAPDKLFLRAAVGANLVEKDGWLEIDGQYRVQATGAQVRTVGGKKEVLLPVAFASGQAKVSVTYAWMD